jgi:DMSO/TMAO reductase YedYZ molybdopterin-dependent catalytic subunit
MVPGHYAMRSVKWLTAIDALTEPFDGHFVNRYQYLDDSEFEDGTPVGPIQVRSVIAKPGEGDRMAGGAVEVAGSAWSGLGPITLVEVSIDGTWFEAELTPGAGVMSATAWRHETHLGEGPHTIKARATDSTGATQPQRPRWNKRGYANNLVHEVSFCVG